MTKAVRPLLFWASVAVFALGYAETLASFHDRWGSTVQGYSHGYLLAAVGLWLVWRRRQEFRFPAPARQYGWLLMLAGASMAWAAATIMQVRIGQQLMIPALIWLWLASVFGWRRARPHLFALGVVYLAIPIWDVLVLPLRELTVFVTEQALSLLGIPAFIDGFRIHVPAGAFVVAGGCSGLNYLLVSLTLGMLFAHLYVRGWQRRTAVVLSSLLVALVANWIRVVALVLIGYYSEMESGLVDDHESFGWVVFAALLVPYVLILRRLDEAPETKPMAVEGGWGKTWRAWPVAWLATIAGLAGPLLLLIRTLLPVEHPVPLSALAPAQAVERPDWEPDYSGHDRAQHFQQGSGRQRLQLSLYTWLEQDQGREMIYYNNRMAREDLVVAGPEKRTLEAMKVNEMVVQDGRSQRLVWWYYRTAGQATTDELIAKLLELLGVVNGRASAELVTLSTQCEDDLCQRARARMAEQGEPLLNTLEARLAAD